jgi:stringent starvation protein B
LSKVSMTSSRPYLIRALYEWIVDNSLTPHLVVFAKLEGVEVPQQYVNKDGQIVLNVSPSAVMGLVLDNNAVTFNARFGGIPTDIYVPCAAILGIYARENGQGMMFEPESETPPPPPSKPKGGALTDVSADKKPSLRVVK